jgi:peptidase C25-like protein
MRRHAILAFLVFALFFSPSLAADKPTYLLVTAPAFRTAVEPLCRHRKAQGFNVQVLQTTDVLTAKDILRCESQKLQDHVTRLARKAPGPVYILLVGAVDPTGLINADLITLPPCKGTISRMKNHPTDHGYGDPDASQVCRIAVGRLPARNEEEAAAMVKKIIDFEQDQKPGEWRRRLTVLAGVPEFNPVVDALVERLALAKLERIDLAWSGRAIYHNHASRYCLPDQALHQRALDYVQAGQAMTLYLGHSGPGGFWAGGQRFLDRTDWAGLKIPTGKGIFATFGCLGCQLQGVDGEGYGVAAIRNPEGPVAVIGSHGVCFAAMVQVAADGLFESMLARQPPERLGQVWLGLQKHLAKGPLNPITFRLLDAVDGNSQIPESVQRPEHLEMFLLLGDPAMRLPAMANDLCLQADGDFQAGRTIRIRGEAPDRLEKALVRLTLERPLASEPADLEPLPKQKGADRDRVMLANHDRANRFVLFSKDVVVKNGLFEVEWKLPAALPWPRLVLRAYAATDRHEAIATLPLSLSK